MLTTEFKKVHNLTDRQFNRLHGKVREAFLTSHPDLHSDPTCDLTQVVVKREGSTKWVILYPELFEAELQNLKSRSNSAKQDNEPVEAEIVESFDLANGSQLVVRNEFVPAPFVPALEIRTETKRNDLSAMDALLGRLKADVEAKRESEEIADLYEHAQRCEQQKKNRDLIEMLIAQGYSAEQAITIAQGAKNLTPVGK